MIEKVYNVANLEESLHRVALASGWKNSTQKLILNHLKVYNQIYKDLTSGKPYVMQNGSCFILNENGKERYIQALTPKDIVMQHTLTNYILIPILTRYLIHDNGASIKNKGLSFTRKRFDLHLRKFYRKYGRNGYILKIDFRKYFDNIHHDKLLEELKRHLPDDIMNLIEDILVHYEVDVSYTDDVDIINKVFNSLEYIKIPKDPNTSKRYMRKSLGIGSPVSQIFGIYFPHRLDQYCKTVLGLKYYDAYMDDRIIMSNSKDELIYVIGKITEIAISLGITINPKKTVISPLSRSFTFLKTRYMLTKSGEVIHRLPKKAIATERKRLKKLAKIVVNENLDVELYKNQYKSWRGDKKWYKCHKSLKELDKVYKEGLLWIRKKKC